MNGIQIDSSHERDLPVCKSPDEAGCKGIYPIVLKNERMIDIYRISGFWISQDSLIRPNALMKMGKTFIHSLKRRNDPLVKKIVTEISADIKTLLFSQENKAKGH